MYSREVIFLPHFQETLISTQTRQHTLSGILAATTSKLLIQDHEDATCLFNGWAKGNRFRISLKINRPNNYLPLVLGRIDPTSSGCIIFLTYRLFPTTRLFLVFWDLFILISSLIASYQYQTIWYGLAGVVLIAFIQWIAWSNFNLQLKETRALLINVLTH